MYRLDAIVDDTVDVLDAIVEVLDEGSGADRDLLLPLVALGVEFAAALFVGVDFVLTFTLRFDLVAVLLVGVELALLLLVGVDLAALNLVSDDRAYFSRRSFFLLSGLSVDRPAFGVPSSVVD